jgi:hypothetical protein
MEGGFQKIIYQGPFQWSKLVPSYMEALCENALEKVNILTKVGYN